MENVNWKRQGIDLNQFVKHSGMEIQQIMSYYIYCQTLVIRGVRIMLFNATFNNISVAS
jgi:hypothetical protein